MQRGSGSRIVRIEGFEVACALPEVIGNAVRFFDRRSSLVVAVTTAEGVTGWGETWAFPSAASTFVRESFGPVLMGRDALKPAALWHAMASRLGYDRRGLSHMAMGALDMATWDAAARTQGVPLSDMLGGALRDRITAYVSGPFLKPGATPYAHYPAEIETYLAAGFRAIKLRMGTSPKTDGRMAGQVRDLIGPDMLLMADLNEGFTVRAALDVASELADSDLVWLEEPIQHDDLDGYRRLSRALPMALAGGEALCGLSAFRDFIAAGALDLVQPDLALCGGITEGIRIAALAEAFNVPVVPHVWGTAINFHASIHFAAILPEKRGPGFRYPLFEYDPSYNPLRTVFGETPVGADGSVKVPDAPGLGVEITAERLEPFTTKRWVVE